MAEVTNNLIYEVLKPLQADMSVVKSDLLDVKVRLDRVDDRLERRVGLMDHTHS